MPKSDLKLPALRINERSVVKIGSSGIPSLHRLSEDVALKGGFGVPTYFIDARMRKFEIRNVIPVRRSFHPFVIGAKVRWYIVRYELSESVQLTLDEVKRTLIDLVVSKGWYRQGGQSKEEFIKEFQSPTDIAGLMGKLSAYGKVQF